MLNLITNITSNCINVLVLVLVSLILLNEVICRSKNSYLLIRKLQNTDTDGILLI